MYRTSVLAIFLSMAAHTATGEPVPETASQAPPPQASRAYSTAAIDRYLESEMRRQKIPGISLAVVRNGQALYVKSYGVATLEHAVPVTPQTVFQIGSVGKPFTAVAVMMLAGEHKLD